MKIALSFATILSSNFDFNEKIEFFQDFDIDGVEMFGQELPTAQINDASINALNNYAENSIHMPNRGVYDASEESKNMVARIIEKARMFKVNKLTFHSHQIQDYKYVFNDGFCSAIENAPDGKKKIGLQTVEENRTILKAHPGLKLVLDPTHALVNSIMPKDFLKLQEYIIGIQLSGIGQIGGKSTDHLSLINTPKEILGTIRPLLDVNTTFTIESTLDKVDKNIIEDEINFVKNKFYM